MLRLAADHKLRDCEFILATHAVSGWGRDGGRLAGQEDEKNLFSPRKLREMQNQQRKAFAMLYVRLH